MELDKHKIWLIIGIAFAILIVGFLVLYPNVKEGFVGHAGYTSENGYYNSGVGAIGINGASPSGYTYTGILQWDDSTIQALSVSQFQEAIAVSQLEGANNVLNDLEIGGLVFGAGDTVDNSAIFTLGANLGIVNAANLEVDALSTQIVDNYNVLTTGFVNMHNFIALYLDNLTNEFDEYETEVENLSNQLGDLISTFEELPSGDSVTSALSNEPLVAGSPPQFTLVNDVVPNVDLSQLEYPDYNLISPLQNLKNYIEILTGLINNYQPSEGETITQTIYLSSDNNYKLEQNNKDNILRVLNKETVEKINHSQTTELEKSAHIAALMRKHFNAENGG